jgi:hypothetical protein
MGTTFTHSTKARNRQPDKGTLVDLDEELRQWKVGFCHTNASPEEQARILAMVAKIVAEEPLVGCAITGKLQTALEGLGAQVLKNAVPIFRRRLEAMRAADALVATSESAETLGRNLAEAAEALEQAEERLRDAMTARDAARDEVASRTRLDARRREAVLVLSTTDPEIVAAWEHWQRIRPE